MLSRAPIARSWSSTRPISRSMRSTIAAWIAILVAWNRFCSSVSSFQATGVLGLARPDASASIFRLK